MGRTSKRQSAALAHAKTRLQKRMMLRTWVSGSPRHRRLSAEAARFFRRVGDLQGSRDYEEEARHNPTLLVRRTLRSGQRVWYHGHVVVLGDVNPGAEVCAGGDIVVMGWLRGLAHAGAAGDDAAKVSAFRLDPVQLRIGQYIGRAPDHDASSLPEVPEIAEVRDGHLVIDRWQGSVLTNMQEPRPS